MEKEIKITKKSAKRGDDGYKIVSVRMRDETIARLDAIAGKTNRSRNEVINILLDSAIQIVKIDEEESMIWIFIKIFRENREKKPFIQDILQRARRFAGMRRKVVLHDSAESTRSLAPFVYAL